jgi:murein L,D-transpeptidase YafK
VQLQIFPFRMNPQNLARHASSPHLAFWKDIKEGYDRFELTKRPPTWDVCNREYVFDIPRNQALTVLDAVAACPADVGEVTTTAALQQKQAADEAALQAEVALLAEKEAKAATEAERIAAEQAALKARGEAISGFIGGIFGSKEAEVQKTVNPALQAPRPAPRIQRG